MKDDFSQVVINNGIIREVLTDTMKYKKPYTILNVISTGADFSAGDRLMRVFAAHYDFDAENKKYEAKITFDEVLAGTKESKALLKKNARKQELFANASITEADYFADKNVISEDEFKTKFRYFCDAVANSGTIIANDLNNSIEALNKIGEANWIRNRMYGATAFEQDRVKNDLYPSATRDLMEQVALREFGVVVNSYKDNIDVLHKMVTAYGLNEDLIKDNQILEVINQAKEALSEQGVEKYRNGSIEYKFESWLSGRGALSPVTPYAKNSKNYVDIHTPNMDALEDAINNKKPIVIMQASTTGISPTDVPIGCTLIALKYDEELKNYVRVMTSEDGHKKKLQDIVFMQGSKNAVLKSREKFLKDKEKCLVTGRGEAYDCFAHAGLDYEEYIKGYGRNHTPLLTEAEAKAHIAAFFEKAHRYCPDFVMVSNSSSSIDKNISFSGAYLKKIGNLAEFEMPFIDGTQLLKEYTYQKYTGRRDFGDSIIDFSNWKGEKFGLEDFFAYYIGYENEKELIGCDEKAAFTGQIIMTYVNDYYAEKEKQQNKASVVAIAQPVAEKDEQQTQIPSEKEEIVEETYDLIDDESFFDSEMEDELEYEDAEPNNNEVKNKDSVDSFEDFEQFADFDTFEEEDIELIEKEENNSEVYESEELVDYEDTGLDLSEETPNFAFNFGFVKAEKTDEMRDRVDDKTSAPNQKVYGSGDASVDIVVADNVKKVGEAKLPNVEESSEYKALLAMMQKMMSKIDTLTEQIDEQRAIIDKLSKNKVGKGKPED